MSIRAAAKSQIKVAFETDQIGERIVLAVMENPLHGNDVQFTILLGAAAGDQEKRCGQNM